jgi:hypothetical protein
MRAQFGLGNRHALLCPLELIQQVARIGIAPLCHCVIGKHIQPRDFITQCLHVRLKLIFVVERFIDALTQVFDLAIQVRGALKARQAGGDVTQLGARQGIQFLEQIIHHNAVFILWALVSSIFLPTISRFPFWGNCETHANPARVVHRSKYATHSIW